MLDYFERLCVQDSIEDDYQALPNRDPNLYRINNPTPLTIQRSSGWLASNWSDKDYEEMANTPVEVVQPTPQPQKEEQTNLPAPHTRIQITQYEKSKYIKGTAKNFEVEGDYNQIFSLLQSLKSTNSTTTTRVRVQLQNKVNGKMQGGRNLSIPGTTVTTVYSQVWAILDEYGFLSPKQGSAVGIVPKSSGSQGNSVPTEEGSGFSGGAPAPVGAPTPQTCNTSKTSKRRVSLAAECRSIAQEIQELKAMLRQQECEA